MVPRDGLPHGARSAVDHDPQAAVLVGLKLEEVVPAPQRTELYPTVAPSDVVQRPRAQRPIAELLGQPVAPFSQRVPHDGDDLCQAAQQRPRTAWGLQYAHVPLAANGRHPAANVSSDRLREDAPLGGEGRPDADPTREVDTGKLLWSGYHEITALAFSSDGEHLLLYDRDVASLIYLNAKTGGWDNDFGDERGYAKDVRIAPDGVHALAVTTGFTPDDAKAMLTLWNLQSG